MSLVVLVNEYSLFGITLKNLCILDMDNIESLLYLKVPKEALIPVALNDNWFDMCLLLFLSFPWFIAHSSTCVENKLVVLEFFFQVLLQEEPKTMTALTIRDDFWNHQDTLFARNKDIENRLWLPRGLWGSQKGGMDWEFGINICKLLYIGWIHNKILLNSTGNYIQHPVINHNRKTYEKEYIYVCVRI